MKAFRPVARDLFALALFFYLVLFLLETVFPGFVSYTISLNLILGIALLLGGLSAVLLPVDEEIKPEQSEKLFYAPIKLPIITTSVFVIVPVLLITALVIKNIFFAPKVYLKNQKVSLFSPVEMDGNQLALWNPGENIIPSGKVAIQILNAGSSSGSAGRMAQSLRSLGFTNTTSADSKNDQLQGAYIKFRPEDRDQAYLIKDRLALDYLMIGMGPSGTSSAIITVILGTK